MIPTRRNCIFRALAGLLGLLACLAAGPSAQAQKPGDEHVFRAGASTSNITPPLGSPIVGGWNPIPAQNVHDELHARSLVLDDGRTRLALVICDNVGMPREICDAARRLIEEETGLPAGQVLIASTHTHSAASLRGPSRLLPFDEFNDYQRFVVRRIADGVRRAIQNLEPAQIAFGSVDEPSQVFNRRWYMLDPEQMRNPFGGVDKVRMNPSRGSTALVRPAGPVDPEVSFISVRSAEGRPIALLANYSLHYVGGVRSADISADYFGMFADRIGQLLGADRQDPPFVGIMSNGTSGDVNNVDFTSSGGERLAPYEKMRRVAWLLADKVHGAHQDLQWHDWLPLAAAQTELVLAVRKPSEEMLSYLRGVLAGDDGTNRYHVRERIYAERIEQLAAGPDRLSVALQALRIGDLGIAAIPFEVFTEIGLEIKQNSPAKRTFTIELAGGGYGYLPTPEQHALGGYETWLGTNIVEIEASRKITRTVLDLLGQVCQDPPRASQ